MTFYLATYKESWRQSDYGVWHFGNDQFVEDYVMVIEERLAKVVKLHLVKNIVPFLLHIYETYILCTSGIKSFIALGKI